MYTLKNSWSNHTGLSAANLSLNNYLVMYKWDIRTKGHPHSGWYKGTKRLIHSLLVGWFGPHNLRQCKIVKSKST